MSAPYTIAAWLLIASVMKIGDFSSRLQNEALVFHIFPVIANLCPDSALLIIVGLALGELLKVVNELLPKAKSTDSRRRQHLQLGEPYFLLVSLAAGDF